MNLNKLAVEICKREGGKINLPVAQVKEVLRHALDIFAFEVEMKDLLRLLTSRKLPKRKR